MGKQSAFFALYRSLTNIIDAIGGISGTWEDCLGGPTVDDWKDTDDLEKEIARLDSLLADEQVTAIGDEPLRLVRQGVDALKTWVRTKGWRANGDTSDQRLERSVRLLEDGWAEIERFIERMARRAFGYWGAQFLSLLEHEQIELFCEEMKKTEKQDMKALLNAEDTPDEAIDLPPARLLSRLQRDILDLLDETALKKEELAHELWGDSGRGRQLYRPGALQELMEHGMVVNQPGVGYWRPDCPPRDMVSLLRFPGEETSGTSAANDDPSSVRDQDDLLF